MQLQRNQLSPTIKREFQNLSKRLPQLSDLKEAAGEHNAERVHLSDDDLYRDEGEWEIPSWGYPSPAGRFTGTIDWRKNAGQLDGVRIREIDGKLEDGSSFNLRPSGNYYAGTAGTSSQAWGPHRDLPGIPTGEYSIWQAKMDSEEEAKLIPEVKSFFENLKDVAKAGVERPQSPLSPGEKRRVYVDVEGVGPMRGSLIVSKENPEEVASLHLGTDDRSRSFSYVASDSGKFEVYSTSNTSFTESFVVHNETPTAQSVVEYEATEALEQPYLAALS